MNFFEHQAHARKQTKLLVGYFILAVIFITLSLNIVVYFIFCLEMPPEVVLDRFIQSKVWLLVSVLVPGIILLVSLIRYLTIAKGGIALAKMLNAIPIPPHTKDFKLKRFLHIVEEMSIASGVPIPQLFVLPDSNINAMVAGYHPQDTVMIVTQGALDTLNRDELQGVVGHEFSHISNGDIKINLKLVGVLAGILFIMQLGRVLLYAGNRGSSARGKGRGSQILYLAIGLMIIGSIGWFFGRLIKAGVSRQRELLADACSVQYTRNPHGLVSAFRRMKMIQEVGKLDSKHIEDINHMCLLSPSGHKEALSANLNAKAYSNPLATHPPLQYRINKIDPHNRYPLLPEDSANQPAPETKASKQQSVVDNATTAVISAAVLAQSIGQPSEANFIAAQQIYHEIPERIKTIAHDSDSLIYLLLALPFVRYKLDDARMIIKSNDGFSNIGIFAETRDLLENVSLICFVPILNLALATYAKLDKTTKNKIYKKINDVLTQFPPSPFRFCYYTLLDKYTHLGKHRLFGSEISDLNKCANDVANILAMLLFHAQMKPHNCEVVYNKLMQQLVNKHIPMPVVREFNPVQVNASLQRLNKLNALQKERLINALTKAATIDKQFKIEELEMLRVICECLECPLPAIAPP